MAGTRSANAVASARVLKMNTDARLVPSPRTLDCRPVGLTVARGAKDSSLVISPWILRGPVIPTGTQMKPAWFSMATLAGVSDSAVE